MAGKMTPNNQETETAEPVAHPAHKPSKPVKSSHRAKSTHSRHAAGGGQAQQRAAPLAHTANSGAVARTTALSACVGALRTLQAKDRQWVINELPGTFDMQTSEAENRAVTHAVGTGSPFALNDATA